MPQIAQLTQDSWYVISQIFWLVVTFGLVFFVIGRGMAPKVVKTVEDRDAAVAADIAAADAARRSADEAEETWRAQENAAREQAKKKLAEARATGAAAAEQKLAGVNAQLDARIAEAEARIASAQQAALAEVNQVAADAARDIVQRVAGTSVDDAEARRAVEAVLHG